MMIIMIVLKTHYTIVSMLLHKKTHKLKAILKRCVLRLVLKESRVSEYFIKSGSIYSTALDGCSQKIYRHKYKFLIWGRTD